MGTNVTTRNPNDVNNFAFDAKLIGANGVLPNNATTANIVVTTSGDTYFTAVVTFATDLYAPNITSSKSVTNVTHPGGPDRRGDTLRYTVSYKNTGADPAANFVMRDSIPAGTTYVPGACGSSPARRLRRVRPTRSATTRPSSTRPPGR